MRDVLIVAKCDRCKTTVDVDDQPLPKWKIDGVTYRPELCDDCDTTVSAQLSFLTPITRETRSDTAGPREPRGGKFQKQPTPCPVCQRVFPTPAGISQHTLQVARREGKGGAHARWRETQGKESPTPTPGLTCSICGKGFNHRAGLSSHMRQTHSTKGVTNANTSVG